MRRTGMAYIAIAPCGCVSACLATGFSSPNEDAKDIASWVKRGDTIEHMTMDEARAEMTRRGFKCGHDPKWGRTPANVSPAQERLAV